MAGLVARFLPVVEAFFVANARDPQGNEPTNEEEVRAIAFCNTGEYFVVNVLYLYC